MHLPDWINAAILGIVQGLTEFLPISSTGHLMVAGKWMGYDHEMFNVVIQIGSLLAVWWLFRNRIWRMIPFGPQATTKGRQLLINVTVAFLPAMIAGYFGHHWIKTHLFSIKAIAAAMIAGGGVILLVEILKPKAMVQSLDDIPFRLALLVGIGQCLALWPGVSRSGATIITGLAIGLSRTVAAEFTFLLAIPTMSAAAVYELYKYRHTLDTDSLGMLAIGFIMAFLSAWVVVKWFIRFIQNHTFNPFAFYRIVFGIFLFILLSRGFFS
ncbi:MAG: undecaprenyl-diphosphate phosphatase [Verrucomicrobiae bacterium]|nr:undecaprenyl-diphosphate phosphatase [Verrucomicrobiae bacterium]